MIFEPSRLAGVHVIDIEPWSDDRGFFARTFCRTEFEAHGLDTFVAQCNLSVTKQKGTIRGMHFQVEPASETKLVRCTRGSILDVVIDIRRESSTYLQHITVELTADNRRCVYIPKGFAHGFQTLADDTEVVYQMGEYFRPGYDKGLRYDDPLLAISWPLPVTKVSEKDTAWPLLVDAVTAV